VRDRYNTMLNSMAQMDGQSSTSSVIFHSVLFEGPAESAKTATIEAPNFFSDLNLGQIIDAITADWKDYDLAPFYYTPLNNLDAIAYAG